MPGAWLRPYFARLLVCGVLLHASIGRAMASVEGPPEPEPPSPRAARHEPDRGRIAWAIAGGPALEVSTPGGREAERGLVVIPSVGFRATSWFEYVIEGHVTRFFTPTGGHVVGVVPVGWRLHTPGRTHPFLAMGAGLTWTDMTDLAGLDRRMNFLTQIGAGLRSVRTDGSAVWVEGRFSHLSNMSTAPPNLGMENFVVLVGYGW